MDSNDLEKERGITILAKCTSIEWDDHHGHKTRINIVDTPGHADFGGEVERILSMVDGVILLVDAAEGAMPQTKFVTGKALALGLRPIVVVNKIDRSDARAQEVLDEVFDLFVSLEANDDQLDFPVLFASGRKRLLPATIPMSAKARSTRCSTRSSSMCRRRRPIPTARFKFLVTLLDRDNFLGRILTGLVFSGSVKTNMPIHALDPEGKIVETGRASKIMAFRGLERLPVEEANAGDIISLAGLTIATVANTICDPSVTEPLHAQAIDPPTLSMRFCRQRFADGGARGQQGDEPHDPRPAVPRGRIERRDQGDRKRRPRQLRSRRPRRIAARRADRDDAARRLRNSASAAPACCSRTTIRATRPSPTRPSSSTLTRNIRATVVEKMNIRKAEMTDMRPSGGGKTRITFSAPSRGMIGYHGEFLSDTRGTGIMKPAVRKIRPAQGPHRRSQERRADLERVGRGECLCARPARGARHHDGRARRSAVRGHDHRREREDRRSRSQPDEGQGADQLPRVGRQGRRDPADPALAADAGNRQSPISTTTSWSK